MKQLYEKEIDTRRGHINGDKSIPTNIEINVSLIFHRQEQMRYLRYSN